MKTVQMRETQQATNQPPTHSQASIPSSSGTRAKKETRLGLSSRAWLIVLVAIAAAILEFGPRVGLLDPYSLVPLSAMVIRAGELLGDPEFIQGDLLHSLSIIAAAFIIAAVLGIAVGILAWAVPAVRKSLDPWLSVYYAIPTFALYPLLVVVLGMGAAPILTLGVLFAIVAVISATIDGLDAIPDTIQRLMKCLQLTAWQRVTKVLIPAALPQISRGLRLCLYYSIIVVIASEFVLSTQGLGHYISRAFADFSITNMYAGVLIVFTIAAGANILFAIVLTRKIDKRGIEGG